LREAAAQGNLEAQLRVYRAYAHGDDVMKNAAEAEKWRETIMKEHGLDANMLEPVFAWKDL